VAEEVEQKDIRLNWASEKKSDGLSSSRALPGTSDGRESNEE